MPAAKQNRVNHTRTTHGDSSPLVQTALPASAVACLNISRDIPANEPTTGPTTRAATSSASTASHANLRLVWQTLFQHCPAAVKLRSRGESLVRFAVKLHARFVTVPRCTTMVVVDEHTPAIRSSS
ncbi:hypothetical protein F4803DRAFT_552232 [Xylaria telfairii]|nr:hypothetical protein F4803DRAFT_552232 [Xylaria telfairii]